MLSTDIEGEPHVIARIRKSMEEEQGFTLIELLVVMIIIGILAAIAIPVFLSQRRLAVDASIKSDLRTVATTIESVVVDSKELPATVGQTGAGVKVVLTPTGASPVAVNVGVSANNVVAYKITPTVGGYCLTGTNAGGTGKIITYNSLTGGLGSVACP